MEWIVRKISRAKWEPKIGLEPSLIAADAVTNDLRTSSNRLSFWECGDDPEGVAVALAASLERPDRMDIAWVERQLVESSGIKFDKTKGCTPVANLTGLHLDAIDLDLSRIEKLARLLAEAIRINENHKRLTKEDVLELLSEAVREGRLFLDDLSANQAKLRDALEKRLGL